MIEKDRFISKVDALTNKGVAIEVQPLISKAMCCQELWTATTDKHSVTIPLVFLCN